jgi:hypothetical protein
MNFLRKIIMLGVVSVSFVALNMKVHAVNTISSGDYALSCTNAAYGTQNGSAYIDERDADKSYGMYTGEDCVYSGAGRTNSSVIVGGELARAAANSIIGSVSGRLSSAFGMNSNTAAHMSYSSNGNGIGMAANHLIGGLSIWTNFSSSNFENDQTFTGVQIDTNAFDGDASAVSFGVDKRIGNLIVGIVGSGFDSDIDITANSGNITVEGETYGIYVGMNTGAVTFSAGAGTGEYEVETKRKDLGSLKTITATDITADVQYVHANISGNLNRGKLSFSPRVAYRDFEIDMPSFTDNVPTDSNTFFGPNATAADQVTVNETIAGKTYSSQMTEAGMSIALSVNGKLTPYVDIAYVHEDTTAASYKTELSSDAADELGASAPDSYVTYGGGIILSLSDKVSGYLNLSETTTRTDFSETSISGSLRLKF